MSVFTMNRCQRHIQRRIRRWQIRLFGMPGFDVQDKCRYAE